MSRVSHDMDSPSPIPAEEISLPVRWSAVIWQFLGCLMFGVLGVFLILRNGHWAGYLSVVFFGLGLVLAGAQLAPGMNYLRISPDGLRAKFGIKERVVHWQDVECFGILVHRMLGLKVNKFIGYRFTEESGRASRISRACGGFDSLIPNYFQCDLEKLAATLNTYVASRQGRPVPETEIHYLDI